jgi:hypothetical protein
MVEIVEHHSASRAGHNESSVGVPWEFKFYNPDQPRLGYWYHLGFDVRVVITICVPRDLLACAICSSYWAGLLEMEYPVFIPWFFQDDLYSVGVLRLIISVIAVLLGSMAGLFGKCTAEHPDATPLEPLHLAALIISDLQIGIWLYILASVLLPTFSALLSYGLFLAPAYLLSVLWRVVSYSDWLATTPAEFLYLGLAYLGVAGEFIFRS